MTLKQYFDFIDLQAQSLTKLILFLVWDININKTLDKEDKFWLKSGESKQDDSAMYAPVFDSIH